MQGSLGETWLFGQRIAATYCTPCRSGLSRDAFCRCRYLGPKRHTGATAKSGKHAKLAAPIAADVPAVPHAAFADTAHWLTAADLQPAPAPAVLDWLFDDGSLTRRLIALSSDAFSVTPLQESWQTLRSDECQALNVREGSVGWVREVFLRGHGQPWVFARSVASRSQLIHSDLHMDELGSRSLGELLFSDQAFSRGEMQVCRYPQHWLPAAVSHSELWARRSLFSRNGLGVLVAEVFLPELWLAAGATHG